MLGALRPPALLARRLQLQPPVRTAVVAAPPTVRISLAEKVFHGCLMSFIWLSYPAWALYNIPAWREAAKG